MSVASIAQRLSLRAPQSTSLEILARLADALALPPSGGSGAAFSAIKSANRDAQLAAAKEVVPSLGAFDRAFPSFTFALATGVGKTRLMGAAIAHLHQAHGVRHFFVVAPNLTIYEKLRADFTPNTRKYVFEGLADFAVTPPMLITGDDWDSGHALRGAGGDLFGEGAVHINLFNIAKFGTDDGRRMRRMHEAIGESYFDYLAGLPDLVLLMDESHRYRAASSAQALDDLKPLMGLEFTATPQTQQGTRVTPFRNIAYEYKLADAIRDGFVKRPAVAGRLNFDADAVAQAQLDRIKLEDALVLHEKTKAELTAYAQREGLARVKPFVLVIARNIEHASSLQELLEGPTFHGGIYAGRVITVHSNRTGAEKDEVIQRLLRVESADEPTEIVIHVEKLKEGWDVTNLYTIVPLRAAESRTLVEQSIGRGLRLPYGKPTGVAEVDRLTIVAHDRFQEIVDDAERPDSPFKVERIVIDPDDPLSRVVAVSVAPNLAGQFAPPPVAAPDGTISAPATAPMFERPEEQRVASVTYDALRQFRSLPSSAALQQPEQRAAIEERVRENLEATQFTLGAVVNSEDIGRIVERVIDAVAHGTIDVPRIVLQPSGETRVSYTDFVLDTSGMRYAIPSEEILLAELQSRERVRLSAGIVATENRPEDYVVRALIDEPDIDYDAHGPLLYALAGQAVDAVRGYAVDDDKVTAVLAYFGRDIASKVASQLRAHRLEVPAEYVPEVREGWAELHSLDRTAAAHEPIRDFRATVPERYRMRQMRFGGFRRCLFPEQQFHSDGERRFAVLLEDEGDESLEWFRPGKRDLRIFWNADNQYVPDFIVETADAKLIVEIKDAGQVEDAEVVAKSAAAGAWCGYATAHTATYGGKPWRYVLVHDADVVATADLAGILQRRGNREG
jgi:type III restriction enzyme